MPLQNLKNLINKFLGCSFRAALLVNNYENEKKEIFKGALRGCI